MQAQWIKILIKFTVWLAIEIFLNFVGLDTLANYTEFIFERHAVATPCLAQAIPSQVGNYRPELLFCQA